MDDAIVNIGYLINRYLHIVCTTLLVGGTLFYEMVVPVAISELRTEHQLAVFGRARWVFRQIVWGSAAVLIISGAVSSYKHLTTYDVERPRVVHMDEHGVVAREWTAVKRPGWWWAAHVSTGTLAVVIALFLTIGGRPPEHPIGWMRLNLTILLIVIFLGSVTRHTRMMVEHDMPPPRTAISAPD
jgi:peptidoglycan/LPS O-acetylase OafA/YrhL